MFGGIAPPYEGDGRDESRPLPLRFVWYTKPMRILFYLVLAALAALFIQQIFALTRKESNVRKPRLKVGRKLGPDVWVQVYDTNSLEEARSLEARLEEEELECLVYEQGRKDVHGNPLKGFGIAVPRAAVPRAQKIVVRM